MSENSRSEAVKKMLEYIGAHLREPLTLSLIAKAAGYSQYHAARIFKEETDLSPFEYIRRERLTEAAHALRNEPSRVLDVALDFVFDSHEGFTRAFTNAFGIAPKKFALYPEPDDWNIPFYYLDRLKTKSLNTKGSVRKMETNVIFAQIMERPARKLLLYRSKNAAEYYQYNEEIANDPPQSLNGMHPWDYLCGVKEALYEPVGVWLPENMRPEGTGIYAHAVEVPENYSGEIPEGFDIIDLPPCKYFVFQGEPYDEKGDQAAVGACMNNIEKFNPQVYGYRWCDELGPRFQLAPMGWRGYIEGRPVREANN